MTDADLATLTAEIRNLTAEVRALRESWRCAKAPRAERQEGAPARAPASYPDGMEAFWSAYACVRRRDKPAVLREWKRLGCERMVPDVLTALAHYKLSAQWKDGYMPEPARWLKSEPWLDEPVTPEPTLTLDPWEPKR